MYACQRRDGVRPGACGVDDDGRRESLRSGLHCPTLSLAAQIVHDGVIEHTAVAMPELAQIAIMQRVNVDVERVGLEQRGRDIAFTQHRTEGPGVGSADAARGRLYIRQFGEPIERVQLRCGCDETGSRAGPINGFAVKFAGGRAKNSRLPRVSERITVFP